MRSDNRLDVSLLPGAASVGSDAQLLVDGHDVHDLAEEYGTPYFAYDLNEVRSNFLQAMAEFGPGVAYASKAFITGRIIDLAREVGLSLDVSTDGEYELARAAGFPAERLVVHGNNKSDWLLARAVEDDVQWVVIDNYDDFERLSAMAGVAGRRPSVLLRVNPGIEVHTHDFFATGNRTSKFGVPSWTGEARSVIEAVRRDPNLTLKGIHTHVGSQVFSLDNFARGLESLADIIASFAPEVVVAGGGLGVRYLNTDVAPTFGEWAAAVKDVLRHIGFSGQVLAEPGRCMVARAALTVYTVGTVRQTDTTTIVAIDGGMSDNPRPVLYDSGYEVVLAKDVLAPRRHSVRLVGSHCESGDTLVPVGFTQAMPRRGDLIVTPVTGAYGLSLSSNYNKMLRPTVLYLDRGDVQIGIRREAFEDLRATDTFFA